MRTLASLSLAVLAALVVACGSDDPTPTATATATASPTATAATAEATATPASAYPLTVHDLLGREVTIEARPERIVTTSPSAIEMLYAAGGTAIARSTTATHVPGTDALVDVGPSYAPAFEVILQQQPDLVIADASAQGHLKDAFEGSLRGVPVVFVGALTYADIGTSVRLLGQVIDHPEAAAAADDIDAVAAAVEKAVAGEAAAKALVLVAGRDGGLSAALDDSFIGDLIRIAGAENVAAGLPQSGQVPGYALVSPESVVATEPDVVLLIVPGNMPGPPLSSIIAQQFPTLQAVTNERVHEIDLEVYLQAPGPRAADGLKALVTLLHPGVSVQ